MSQVTSPVILDSTGQDIVTQLATISAALAADIVITGNTDTTLSGVLQGTNGKVAVKPVDASPTAYSTNLVSSGGVKTALDTKADQTDLDTKADQTALDTKADQTDLSSIHATGTTNATGATITKNTYFYLNNVLVQAKADIASGATYTSGTNYEAVTAGGLNDLMSAIDDVKIGYTNIDITGQAITRQDSGGYYGSMHITDLLPSGAVPISATIIGGGYNGGVSYTVLNFDGDYNIIFAASKSCTISNTSRQLRVYWIKA